MSLGRAAALWALAMGTCLTGRPAAAFQCTRGTDASGNPTMASLAWPSRSVPVALNTAGTVQLAFADVDRTLRAAIDTWQNITLRGGESCTPGTTDLQLVVDPNGTAQDFAGYNYLAPQINRNVLMFRDQGWEHGVTGAGNSVIALTSTTANTQTGAIFDADIEFNSADFAFSVGDYDIQTDLLNTATHELGHLLGFAHSLDETATMFFNAPLHDTLKRQLSCDDAAIMVLRYPAGAPTGYCAKDEVNDSCGFCALPTPLQFAPVVREVDSDDGRRGWQCSGGGGGGGGAAAATLALVALGRRRLRRRG